MVLKCGFDITNFFLPNESIYFVDIMTFPKFSSCVNSVIVVSYNILKYFDQNNWT